MKIFRYANVFLNRLEFKRRAVKLHSIPMDVQIEITTKCNLKCPMCERTYWEKDCKDMNKDMSFDVFKKVMKNFKKSYSVHLTGIGENMLNKDFVDMLRYLKKKNYFFGFTDNFTLIDEKFAKEILETGVNHIVVSFDAHNKEVYDKIRVNGNFDKFLENTTNFVKMIKEGKYKTSFTSNTVVTKYNQYKLQEIVDLIKSVGIDDMSFDVLADFGYNSDMAPDRDKIKQMFDDLKKNNPDIILKFGILGNTMLRDCGAPWKTVIITYDAQVLPCCFSTQRGDREKTIKIASYGSLLNNKFVDIWNNEKYKILRKNIKENKPYAICTNCALICNGKQE